jgi:hypothetical protein
MQRQHDTRVSLRVNSRYAGIIRRELTIARDGRLEDLTQMPGQVSDPARTRRQIEMYDALLRQLAAADVLTGNADELRALLTELAASTDAAQEYERIAAEHHAFAHLLDQFDAEERGRA